MIDVEGFPTRILIVDDHDGNRSSLARTLRYEDPCFLVATARNGEEALGQLDSASFDIVLCDLVLTGTLDGIAVTRRAGKLHPNVRVVVFTGQETGESKEIALDAGAFSYLSKPVPHRELTHAIRTVNSIRKTERLHSWFETLTGISYDLQASFDFEALAKRIVEGVCDLGYSRARLYLLDEERQVLVGKVAAGMPSGFPLDPYEIPLEAAPIIGRIFSSDRPLFCNKAAILERFGVESAEPWLYELGLEEITWVDCPLLVRNRRVGTLAIDQLGRPDYRYTEEDRQILTVFSGLAAQALNNSRLYEQEALARSSLQSILKHAPDAVITTELDGTINIVSPSSERVLGFSPHEMQGRTAAEFYTDAQLTAGVGEVIAREIMEELRRADGEMLPNRRVFLRSKNGARPVLISVSLLLDEDDRPIGTLGILKDLGPLEEQTRHYQDVLEAFGYGTLLLGRRGAITFVNQKAERLLGKPRRQLIDQKFSKLIDPAQVSTLEKMLDELSGGEKSEAVLELTIVQDRGSRIPVSATFSLASGGRVGGAKVFAVALSDKSELGALMQSQRLMALGELVAGIAHEINNPLNLILPAVSDARRILEKQPLNLPDLIEDLKIANEGGRRIRHLVLQFREFARPSDFSVESCSLNDLISESLSFFASRLKNKDVDLRLQLEPKLRSALLDRKRIQQVLLNLVFNADQAMESIRGPRVLTLSTSNLSEGVVLLTVADSGPGIPEELRQSIFDPFFTTKKAFGTGLGLSVSRAIVNLHGGRLVVDSDIAHGACLRVELPAAPLH